MKKVVTRFAPSPTGYLHIGGLRTALFSFLWAKKNKGTFRLRIEDTDQARKVEGADTKLIQLLIGLGLTPDDEVVYQAHRATQGIYKKIALKLVDEGKAYHCFCTAERLAQLRKGQEARKEPPGYDGRCRTLNTDEARSRLQNAETATIRIKWQRHDEKNSFNDHIHGLVSFPAKTVQDMILLKSDGFPTYHLANVVDDHEMGVTHVIRGEEWLPSAPLHGLLYSYLGYTEPEFYHIPLILNPDKSKLSKRQGDVAVEDYLAKGYLKEALINYVAFLGWNPGDEREIFSLDELVHAFELSHVHKAGAIFSIEKLNWYNSWYIKNVLAMKKKNELADTLEPFLPKSSREQRITIFNLFYERVNSLSELEPMSRFLSELPPYDASLLVFKKSTPDKTLAGLIGAGDSIKSFDLEWTAINIELAFKKIMSERSLTSGDIFWPVRAALTGLQASPPPTEVAQVLGRDETLSRINSAIQKLKQYAVDNNKRLP